MSLLNIKLYAEISAVLNRHWKDNTNIGEKLKGIQRDRFQANFLIGEISSKYNSFSIDIKESCNLYL